MGTLRKARVRTEFEQFAAGHADGLLRNAYLMSGDRGEAEDLVQECLVRLARRWPRVRSMDHPGAYARRILFNLAVDGARQRTRRHAELRTAPETDGLDSEDPTAAAFEARASLVQALGELPARQRAVLVLRYFADLPEAEVAKILDCPVGTVKSNASRGLESLREALEPEAPHAVAATDDRR